MTMISPEVQAEILSLHFGEKLGTRAIARRLGINRKAVRRVVERRGVSLKPRAVEGRSSILDPFKPRIEEMLENHCAFGFGNYVQIVHKSGFSVLYGHLAQVHVKNGARVTRGQGIGLEGATGMAGHRHLHWQVNFLGVPPTSNDLLQKPAWGTKSVPFLFRARRSGRTEIFNSKTIHCKWDDMTQKPLAGVK